VNAVATTAGTPALQVDGLHVRFGGRTVLEALSFAVHPGEVLGVAGESGSGKSVTALAVARLLPRNAESAGRVQLGPVDLATLDEPALCRLRGRDLSLVFQEPATALNPLHSIGRQVAETVRVHAGANRAEAFARAAEVLRSVGLPPERVPLERYPHELSGGQRQRVAIALAIAMTPKVLIADEPTTALDVTTQAQVLRLLRERVDETGMGLVIVSHDLAVLATLADRVVVLRDGRLVEAGDVARVLRAPETPYVRDLLAGSRLRPATGAAPRPVEPVTHGSPTAAAAPAPPAAGPLLVAENLVCDYGAPGGKRFRALDGVGLAVHPGERVGLVGESGAGKTTLVRALLGLERPTAGHVRIGGTDPHAASSGELRAARRLVQAVFQDPYGSLNPRHRVERIVAEPWHLLDAPLPAAERRARVEALLASVGLGPDAADRFPHAFSGGQRQRIAIARALAVEPRVVVLDEAVSALDATLRRQILELLEALRARFGLAWLFVSHDLDVIRAVTDRVVVLQAGRIVESGPTARVLASPEHPYTQALLAASPDIDRALAARGFDPGRDTT
jgi:peptide/nickel transport system ATP-binding protein